jgi:hypothetical protein
MADGDGGVVHGARIVAFTEAVMRGDAVAIREQRAKLGEVLSPEAIVDVAGVIASFNVVDRIADSTGIPLDPMLQSISEAVRDELELGRFTSSANTPGASERR